ncbi:MAG: O-methyltransferase family protein [Sphaerisporangium sp.]|nr:O-methyltransferase family protein [Sphaerisporangium sp.]
MVLRHDRAEVVRDGKEGLPMTSTAPEIDSAHGILRLANAFCDAQALLTAAELDLFTVLHEGPATEEDIRGRLGLHGRGLRDFLQLLVALGLLEERNGRYGNAPGAERHLVGGRPGHLGGFLLGAKANLYPVWDGLAETLRVGLPRSAADGFAAMLEDLGELRRYVRMMEGVLQPLIPRIAEAIDWSRYGSVLDVGGCRGGLAGQLALAHHGLAGHVFDLPQIEPLFDEHMAELGTTGKVSFHAGDFFRDPLPRADVLILGHILHNWPLKQREHLVRAAFEAVAPGGVLLVHDRMLDDERANIDNLQASLIMALVTEEGSEYTIGELAELAGTAGFASVSHQPLDENETLVMCHKAGA